MSRNLVSARFQSKCQNEDRINLFFFHLSQPGCLSATKIRQNDGGSQLYYYPTFNWVGELGGPGQLQVTLIFVSVIWHRPCFASYFSPLTAPQYNWIIYLSYLLRWCLYIWSQLELLKVHKNSFNFWTKLIKVFLFLPRNKEVSRKIHPSVCICCQTIVLSWNQNIINSNSRIKTSKKRSNWKFIKE